MAKDQQEPELCYVLILSDFLCPFRENVEKLWIIQLFLWIT